MPEWFYWWIGMKECTRWWLRHCLNYEVRKNPRLTFRWPIFSMPLPEGRGIAIRVDSFGLLPVTPRGNSYILLATDRFSRRAQVFAVTAAKFATESTANILVNKYILLWGCPRTILSNNGLEFCAKRTQAVYQIFGVNKFATSSYHPNGNGMKRGNHAVAQKLAMAVNEHQDGWDMQLPRVEFA